MSRAPLLRRAAIGCLSAMLLGCPPSNDDDSATVVLLDDDDATPADLPTGEPRPEPDGFASSCVEVEPNDAPVLGGETDTLPPPFPDLTDCGALPDGPGARLRMSGRLDRVVQGSWDGDNDVFGFTVPSEASGTIVLQWTPLEGDVDARLWCSTGGAWTDASSAGLATSDLPEVAQGVSLPAGAQCQLFVVAFAAPVVDYVAWIED